MNDKKQEIQSITKKAIIERMKIQYTKYDIWKETSNNKFYQSVVNCTGALTEPDQEIEKEIYKHQEIAINYALTVMDHPFYIAEPYFHLNFKKLIKKETVSTMIVLYVQKFKKRIKSVENNIRRLDLYFYFSLRFNHD